MSRRESRFAMERIGYGTPRLSPYVVGGDVVLRAGHALSPTIVMALREHAKLLAQDALNLAEAGQASMAKDFEERSLALSALADQLEA